MNTVLTNKIVKARKVYDDDCYQSLDFGLLKFIAPRKQIVDIDEAKKIGMSDEDISILQKACDNDFKIQIGEEHRHQCGKYDGEFYNVRLSLPISEILTKYDLWYED